MAEFTALTEANAQVTLSLCRVASIAQERHDEATRGASTNAEMKLNEMRKVMAVRSAEFALQERQSAIVLETSALERLQNMEQSAESRHEDILRVRHEEAQARAMSELQTLQANLAQRAKLRAKPTRKGRCNLKPWCFRPKIRQLSWPMRFLASKGSVP